jgi:hypothetical protein
MKKLFGALLVCGFLAASVAQAAIPPKGHPNKVAHKQAKKAKKYARARKAAKAHKAAKAAKAPVRKS